MVQYRYGYYGSMSDKYFCSQTCKNQWLNENMRILNEVFLFHLFVSEDLPRDMKRKINQSRYGYTFTNIQRILRGCDQNKQGHILDR